MNPQSQAKSLVEVCGGDKEKAWKAAWQNSLTSETEEGRNLWAAIADHCCRIEVLWKCSCGRNFTSGYEAFLHRGLDEGTTIAHHVTPYSILVPLIGG